MAESKDVQFTTSLSSDSKERWAKHAINKLSKGYKLIVSRTRKTANFHKESTGFETCPHRTAMRLISEGYLKETGEHALGGVYELLPEFKEKLAIKKKTPSITPVKEKKAIVDDDDDDDLLDTDDLEDDLEDLDDDFDEEDEEDEEDDRKKSIDEDDD